MPVINGYAFIPETLMLHIRDYSTRPDSFWTDEVTVMCDPPELGDPITGLSILDINPWVPMAFIPLNQVSA